MRPVGRAYLAYIRRSPTSGSLGNHNHEHAEFARTYDVVPSSWDRTFNLKELVNGEAERPGGDGIVITGFGALATHALFATIDPRSGALTMDARRIDFDRQWPDGWNGPAMPHGSLFSR